MATLAVSESSAATTIRTTRPSLSVASMTSALGLVWPPGSSARIRSTPVGQSESSICSPLTSVANIRRFFTQPSPWEARLLDPEWRRSGVDFHRFFTNALNQDFALMRRLTNVNKRLVDELTGLLSFDVALISTGGWAFA